MNITEKRRGRPKKYDTEEERLEAYRKSVREGAKKNYDKNKEKINEKRKKNRDTYNQFLQDIGVATSTSALYREFLCQMGVTREAYEKFLQEKGITRDEYSNYLKHHDIVSY